MRKPPLYRLWRLLNLFAALVVIAVVVITATAIYSLVVTAESGLGAAAGSQAAGPAVRLGSTLNGSDVVETLALPLSNRGYYAISDLTVDGAIVNGTNGTVVVGSVGGVPVTIDPGASGNVSLTARVNLSGASGAYLATHNGSLGTHVRIDWSYAFLYGFSIGLNFTLPWTPPFANLSFVAGTWTSLGNGSRTANVTVLFVNEGLLLNLSGTLNATLTAPSGAACGTVGFPVDTSAGPFNATRPAWLAPGCPTTGLSVTSVFVSPSSQLPLPGEALG